MSKQLTIIYNKLKNINDGVLNQFYLGIESKTKGSVAQYGEIVGAIGQLTGEEGRLAKDTSCGLVALLLLELTILTQEHAVL